MKTELLFSTLLTITSPWPGLWGFQIPFPGLSQDSALVLEVIPAPGKQVKKPKTQNIKSPAPPLLGEEGLSRNSKEAAATQAQLSLEMSPPEIWPRPLPTVGLALPLLPLGHLGPKPSHRTLSSAEVPMIRDTVAPDFLLLIFFNCKSLLNSAQSPGKLCLIN
jgi:hypothetical protein